MKPSIKERNALVSRVALSRRAQIKIMRRLSREERRQVRLHWKEAGLSRSHCRVVRAQP